MRLVIKKKGYLNLILMEKNQKYIEVSERFLWKLPKQGHH